MSTDTATILKQIYSDLVKDDPALKGRLFLRRATDEGEFTHIELEAGNKKTLLIYCTTLTRGVVHCRLGDGSYLVCDKN